MTPAQVANAVLDGAARTQTDLRSALDLTDEVFEALVALAGPRTPEPPAQCECSTHRRLRWEEAQNNPGS